VIRNGSTTVQTAMFTVVVVTGETAPSTSWTTSTAATGGPDRLHGRRPEHAGERRKWHLERRERDEASPSRRRGEHTRIRRLGHGRRDNLDGRGTAAPTREYQMSGTEGEDAQNRGFRVSDVHDRFVTGAGYAGNIIALQPMRTEPER